LRSHSSPYFVTTVISERHALLQRETNAALLSDLIFCYSRENRYLLHAFVVMPDHLHAILTPATDQSLERCMQCIKGGFSHALGKAGSQRRDIWQRGFYEHRIRDKEDYTRHVNYVARNPEKRGMEAHAFVFTNDPRLHPMPEYLRG
jgi:putative transposase